MALKLSKEMPTGLVGDYWRISEIVLHKNDTSCVVLLYKNKGAMRANKEPMHKINYLWSGANNPCKPADLALKSPWDLCYAAIKLKEEFLTATDDEEV